MELFNYVLFCFFIEITFPHFRIETPLAFRVNLRKVMLQLYLLLCVR
jgi:hypothetical protein|uniref:Uncharacterized protein n=1 Tax=Picea glauca TaxID=3330 RepID=A0A124GNP4_PICGL|nr:hypothetical protein ABT39_MTgene4012 [Picea glauca]